MVRVPAFPLHAVASKTGLITRSARLSRSIAPSTLLRKMKPKARSGSIAIEEQAKRTDDGNHPSSSMSSSVFVLFTVEFNTLRQMANTSL